MSQLIDGLSRWLNSRSGTIVTIGVIGFFFAVGVLGHGIPPLYPSMKALTPWFLLLFGGLTLGLVVVQEQARAAPWRSVGWVLIAYAATLLLEIVGANTGIPFGDYSYGKTLGAGIFGVPLIIGLNWVLVILGFTIVGQKLSSRPILAALIAGIGALLFDLLLEPLAMHPVMDYWSWNGDSVPFQNYLTWFATGFLLSLMYILQVKHPIKGWLLPGYIAVQVLFFIGLRLFVLGV